MAEPPPAATSTAAPETTPTARPPSKRDRGSRSSAMARVGFVERLASLARWRATDVRSGDVRPRRRSCRSARTRSAEDICPCGASASIVAHSDPPAADDTARDRVSVDD